MNTFFFTIIKIKEVVMKRNITFTLLLPLLLLSSMATGQAERTFVKSFNLQGKQNVVLDIGDNVQVTAWDNDLMRVQMTVSLPNSSRSEEHTSELQSR